MTPLVILPLPEFVFYVNSTSSDVYTTGFYTINHRAIESKSLASPLVFVLQNR